MAEDTDMPDGAASPADPSQGAPGGDSTTLVTICKDADGSYVVYAGDKPDAGAGEMPGGDAGVSGTPADSIGAALKAALDILKSNEGGDEQGDFQAGFDGGSNASPPKAPAAMPAA